MKSYKQGEKGNGTFVHKNVSKSCKTKKQKSKKNMKYFHKHKRNKTLFDL